MTLQETMKKVISNQNIVIILCLSLLFIGVAIWVYTSYVKPRINATYVANKEYTSTSSDTKTKANADLYFFYTTWCPHCKSAKPVWNQFKEDITTNGHGSGVIINFIEVDCDKDKSTADKFKVTGYPTIKLNYNDSIVEYDAKPDINTLNQFLDQSLIS